MFPREDGRRASKIAEDLASDGVAVGEDMMGAAKRRWLVSVEEMVLPSGKVTCTGLRVGVTSVQRPSIIIKWPLHPLLAMACAEFVGGGAE